MDVYFDNAATTKPYKEVIEELTIAMSDYYGNPSSLHKIGIKCEKRLNEAREYFATTINSDKSEIYFTSGGSEGNNLILKGILKEGHHLITTSFEHSSVLKVSEYINKHGVKVSYLNLDPYGEIDIEELKECINKDTVLVSIMLVNNEMGAIQNIERISKAIKSISSRAKLHVDAVQGYGKIPIDVKKMNIDFLTVSAHKIHGPKGIGFCYIRKGLVLSSLIMGGQQEKGYRAGTENLPGIIAFQKAAYIAFSELQENFNKVKELKGYFVDKLKEIENVSINSPIRDNITPYILNVSFIGVKAEVLVHLLEDANIYVATGSACTAKTTIISGSYVMKSIGLDKKEIESAIRFSFSSDNTFEEVNYTIEILKKSLMFLRRIKR